MLTLHSHRAKGTKKGGGIERLLQLQGPSVGPDSVIMNYSVVIKY